MISLSLSVVLLNILVTFTGGFDMEKYLAKQTCADFVVSTTDYFRYSHSGSFIAREQIAANRGKYFSVPFWLWLQADGLCAVWLDERETLAAGT